MKRLIEFSIRHSLFVNLLTLFVIVGGIVAFVRLNREAFPNVTYDRVLVTTLYPGADSVSVEKLITIPLERELKEVADIKEMRSVSLEGRAVIILEMEPYVKNRDRLINEIQRAVDQAVDLPIDLEDPPTVTEVRSKDRPVIEVSLSGTMSEKQLVQQARILEKKFLDVKGVSGVARKGWREEEIWVEVKPETLSEYVLTLEDLIGALEGENVNIPGGTAEEAGGEFLIRTSAEFGSAKEVERVIVRANDARHWVQVGDVAEVKETFEEESVLHRTNGTRAINLTVIKKERGDLIEVVDAIKKITKEYEQKSQGNLHTAFVNDFSFYVKRRLNVLYSNGLIGFVLVLLCLIWFLSPSEALVTALGIPFALFVTFFVMQLTGVTLNLLTMFGLIIVLGMLVDDALVVTENIHRHREAGLPLRQACLQGVLEIYKPVASSVATTIVAFLPLMFMSGVMGKFVKYIPMMVMVALMASLFEAFIILPSHMMGWTKNLSIKNHRFKNGFQKFTRKYIGWLRFFLAHRYQVALGFGLFFLLGVWIYFLVPFQLFPSRGVETFFIRASAPLGTSLKETARRFERVERLVETLPETERKDYILEVGIQQNDSHDPFTQRFSHIGQLQVFLTPPSKRDRDAEEIVDALRTKAKGIQGLFDFEFELMKTGPPVGKPIAIRVRGENLESVRGVALQIREALGKIEGVKDIKLDEEIGKKELKIRIDPLRLAQAGLQVKDVGRSIRASFEGWVATTIKKTDEEVVVRVRFPRKAKESRENLLSVLIPNARGNAIPLKEVAVFEEQEGLSAIRHFERDRAITVLANVDEKTTDVLRVQRNFQSTLDSLQTAHPDIPIHFTGEFEETQESLGNLKQAFLLGAFLIFILLAVQFNSLWQPLIVMTSIPLGLIGALIAFWIHGEPKSFLALMGMVGLAGVVVNNAIVLVDFVNVARQQGMGNMESLLEAGRLRLRPVLLTSVTTVLGLISLAYGFWGSDPFLKPMALTFVWGLAFSTILTLVAIPCFHAIADDGLILLKNKKISKRQGIQMS